MASIDNYAELFSTAITTLIPPAAALFGVYLANGASIQRLNLQLENENNRQREKIYLEKVEEIYVLTGRYIDTLASHYFLIKEIMKKQIGYEEVSKKVQEDKEVLQTDFERIQMLVDIYFPSLKEELKILLRTRRTGGMIMKRYQEEANIPGIGQQYVMPMSRVIEDLEDLSREIKRSIATKLDYQDFLKHQES